MPYAFDGLRVTQCDVELPSVPLNWWRGTFRNHHAFALECAVDELALATGADPLELRLALLSRDLDVETFPGDVVHLSAARLRNPGRRRAGHAVGLACHCYADVHTYVAHAVEVSLRQSALRIERITAVVDCGLAIVPDAIRAQMAGSVVFGLSSALWGNVEVDDGRILTRNFDRCRVLRHREAPPIDVRIVASAEAPGGMGEPPLPSLTPALLNAIALAGGPRLRSLPIAGQIELEAG